MSVSSTNFSTCIHSLVCEHHGRATAEHSRQILAMQHQCSDLELMLAWAKSLR